MSKKGCQVIDDFKFRHLQAIQTQMNLPFVRDFFAYSGIRIRCISIQTQSVFEKSKHTLLKKI